MEKPGPTEEMLGMLDNNFSTTAGFHSFETIIGEFQYIFLLLDNFDICPNDLAHYGINPSSIFNLLLMCFHFDSCVLDRLTC